MSLPSVRPSPPLNPGLRLLAATGALALLAACSSDGAGGPDRTGDTGRDTTDGADASDTGATDTGGDDTGVDTVPDVPVDCPTAVGGCRLVDSESPALTDWMLMDLGGAVTCSGLHSFPPGHIDVYEWSFVSVPSGSALGGSLGEGADPDVEFTPDVAGRYELALEVVDDEGVRSCTPDSVEINVEGIPSLMPPMSVTLSWEQLDANFDLHLLRADAALFSTPGDCFKDNTEPDWGTAGDLHDPLYSADSLGTDPIAPEVIGIREVEADVPYTGWAVLTGIGSEDNPATEAEAQFAVRVDGETVGSYARVLQASDQWEAFTITFDAEGGYVIEPAEGSGE